MICYQNLERHHNFLHKKAKQNIATKLIKTHWIKKHDKMAVENECDQVLYEDDSVADRKARASFKKETNRLKFCNVC